MNSSKPDRGNTLVEFLQFGGFPVIIALIAGGGLIVLAIFARGH